jgi:EpsI family protein
VSRLPSAIDRIQMDRRRFGLGLAFLSAAGLAAWRMPRLTLNYLAGRNLEDVIPKQIKDWEFLTASGLVIPPEDQLSRALYSQLLTRVYFEDKSPAVMLLVAYSASQTGVLQIHRPEVCYPAGGYALSPVTPVEIELSDRTLRANSLSATNERGTEHVVYWTRVGRHMPLSWAQQRWSVAEDNLRGLIPDAALVRISTIHEDRAEAFTIIGQFIRSLVESLPAESRKILISEGAG